MQKGELARFMVTSTAILLTIWEDVFIGEYMRKTQPLMKEEEKVNIAYEIIQGP